MDTDRRRVLVTGAAGRIGRAFVAEMGNCYRFRLVDRTDAVHEIAGAPHESIVLDMGDLEACRRATAGIDTVLHLAADPNPEADYYASLLSNNFNGVYNIFRAATDAGCARVIFASSVQTLLGYPLEEPLPVTSPVWPLNMYGVSKCFGEATARRFATAEGISAIAVRIGAYEAPWLQERADQLELSAYVSPRDLNQLFRLCIEGEGIDFAIVHGISNNARMRLSLDETRRLVGYAPIDDGFQIYGIDPD